MQLKELVPENGYVVAMDAADKDAVIQELVHKLVDLGELKATEEKKVVQLVKEREKLGSTGFGWGVAVPHCRFEGVNFPVAIFGRSPYKVDFKSVDGEDADLFFLVISPKKDDQLHTEALQQVSKALRDEHFRNFLRKADNDQKIKDLLFNDVF